MSFFAVVLPFIVKYAAVILFVVSVVIQQQAAAKARERQRKAQEEADARAEEAKGTSVVTEGEIAPLKILYGRNLIGGIRVYHNILNTYTFGSQANGGYVFKASTALDGTIQGSKHEFLFVQQALCFSGINLCYQVDIDDKRITGECIDALNVISDIPPTTEQYEISPAFPGGDDDDGNYNAPSAAVMGERIVPPAGTTFKNFYGHGCRTHFYPQGNLADPLMTANDATRATAVFTNTAYATSVYRLNRDEQQYNGTPSAKYYVEGMKISNIIDIGGGVLGMNQSKAYSNNPALCLLDYLTNTVYGKGLAVEFIDMLSFSRAAAVCDKVVMANVPLKGKLLVGKGGTHDVKRYECNTALDSSKPIRDNIELILESMSFAELVWSGGFYKLSLKYPQVYPTTATFQQDEIAQYTTGGITRLYSSTTNSNTSVPGSNNTWIDAIDAYITDNELIREGETSLSWPNAQSRLNFATVRYLNEAIDFVEDTVSWPPKIPVSGNVYATYLAEDNGILLETDSFANGITTYYLALARAEELVRTSRSSVTYELNLNRDYIHLEPGDYIKVTSIVLGIPGEIMRVESVKPDTSEGTIKIEAIKFDASQLAFNAPDIEVVPPRLLFNDSIPQASGLTYTVPDGYPNGVLSFTHANDIRVRRYVIKITDAAPSRITANTVWTDLGQVQQSPFHLPPTLGGYYTLTVVAAGDFRDAPRTNWPQVTVGVPNISTNGVTFAQLMVYKRTASVPGTPSGGSYNFSSMILSPPSGWSVLPSLGTSLLYVSSAVASTIDVQVPDTSIVWSAPAVDPISSSPLYSYATLDKNILGIGQDITGVNFQYNNAYGQMSAIVGDVNVTESSTFAVTQQLNCTVTISNTAGTRGRYTVTNLVGNSGTAILRSTNGSNIYYKTLSVVAVNLGYIVDVTPPPTPTGMSVSTSLNNVFISTTDPLNYTEGHGHSQTIVYSAVGSGSVFANAVYNSTFTGNSFSIPSILNTNLRLWFKFKSIDGIQSTVPAGGTNGIDATTGKIGNVDLGPLIVEAANLADSSVQASKIAALAVTAAKIAASAIETDKIAADAVVAGKIAANAVTTAKIAADAVTTTKIADDAISTPKLIAGAITTAKIAANTIIAGNIAASTITSAQIAAGTITAGNIAANSITATQIAAGTITATELAAGSITAVKIATNAIAVGTAAIQNGAIVNAMIGSLAVDDAKIANTTITGAKIANATITGAKIATATIETANIVDTNITNAKIADGAITTAKIGSAQITTALIGDANITTLKVAGNAITVPVSVQIGSTIQVYSGMGTATVANFSFTASGGQVYVIGSCAIETYSENSLTISVVVTGFGTTAIDVVVPPYQRVHFCLPLSCTPPAGVVNCSLNVRVQYPSAGVECRIRNLFALETKR